MSKESSILKISVLGFLVHSVILPSFRTDFAIHEIAISVIHQPSVLFRARLEKFSLFGTGRSYLCCRLCQMCTNSCYKTG